MCNLRFCLKGSLEARVVVSCFKRATTDDDDYSEASVKTTKKPLLFYDGRKGVKTDNHNSLSTSKD